MKAKHYSIVELIRIDHRLLKTSIEFLRDPKSYSADRLAEARRFLNLFKVHCAAKARTLYEDLKHEEEFKNEVLSSQIRHQRVSNRLRRLADRISEVHWISDELSVELTEIGEKTLEIIDNEESHLLPLMKQNLSELYLCDLGIRFEKLRKFSIQDLEALPALPQKISEKVERHLVSLS